MKWHETRIANYLMFGAVYYLFWMMVGFEVTVIMALGCIMGEISYKE